MQIRSTVLAALAVGMSLALASSPASAYRLQTTNGRTCTKDGAECQVYCTDDANKGQLAGSMFWNGSVWTDGVKWDEDQDAEARKITAAFGNSCS